MLCLTVVSMAAGRYLIRQPIGNDSRSQDPRDSRQAGRL